MKRGRRSIVYFLAILGVIYVAWCAFLFFMQDGMMFPRGMTGPPAPTPFHPRTDRLERPISSDPTDTASVEAWFIPAPGAGPAPLLVFFHGNAELIDYQSGVVDAYHRLGLHVLLVEYRGYGRSAGDPSEEAIVGDALHFIAEVRHRDDVDGVRIALHGRSLGGGIAAQTAGRLMRGSAPPERLAVILESTFTSATSFAARYGVPPFLVRSPFRTDRILPELGVPVLIFHGSEDTLVPTKHGRRLAEMIPTARYVEYVAGHNDFPPADRLDEFWTTVGAFLDEALVP